MKSPQRRFSASSPAAALRSELERLREALRALGGASRQDLRPALVPIPVSVPSHPRRDLSLTSPTIQLAFGRRKDSKGEGDEDGDEVAADDDSDSDSDLDQLPPIPSALGAGELATELESDSSKEGTSAAWSRADSTVVEGADQDDVGTDLEAEAPAEDASRSWTSRPFTASATKSSSTDLDAGEPTPWGASVTDDEPTTFTPAVVDPGENQPENLGWLSSGSSEPTAPWAVSSDAPAAEGSGAMESSSDPVAELDEIDEIDEIEPETPQEDEETGAGPEGLDSFSEVLAVADEPWSSSTLVVEEAVVYQPVPSVSTEMRLDDPDLRTRSFPLPEGDVVFRNLRAGFTDPSRLLRHLAGEGHTGVLHVLGVDQSNSYVVLVDGYVVAVATDRQGNITTTKRISFPNFPNSQDTINVITYPRQIARGLGLLLHAPVRFAGLGAMFVNLEGLRSYLSKYSSSGGLIVHAQDGIGVALFEEGKLVGAYANGNAPTSDLGQLRDLVKDLEAEIDVRFGGPQELEPTPLDTLLSGYPL